MDPARREDLEHAEDLPSPPEVAMTVLEMAMDEEVDLHAIGQVICRDPALTSKLLKVANSPVFGSGRAVGSTDEAILVLGLRTVKVLVLSLSLVETKPSKDGFDTEGFWRSAVTTAVAARVLADRDLPNLRDEAFVAGLLLDLGMLAAKEVWPEDYAQVIQRLNAERGDLLEIERASLGTDHMEVGGFLLRSWQLPERLCAAVAHHHDPASVPDDAPEQTRSLTELLETAAAIGRMFRCELFEGVDEAFVCDLRLAHEGLRRLGGAGNADTAHLMETIRFGIEEAFETFSLRSRNPERLEVIQSEAVGLLHQISLGAALDLTETARDAVDAEDRAELLETDSKALLEQATVDSLTGLVNRRELDRRLAELGPDSPPIGLLMVDLDHFKSVNDVHGHAAGDEVLRRVGGVLARHTDGYSARYGGEEFCVVVEPVGDDTLEFVGESIREAIEALRIPVGGGVVLSPTASLGGATLEGPVTEDGLKDLFARADECLYASKRGGRNRITISHTASAST